MHINTLCAVVVALFISVGVRVPVSAQSVPSVISENMKEGVSRLHGRQRVLEHVQEEIDRLEKKRDQALLKWLEEDPGKSLRSGITHMPRGVQPLEEQLTLLKRLRKGIDRLDEEQQQTLQEWLHKEADQLEATQWQTLEVWLEDEAPKTTRMDAKRIEVQMQQLEREQQLMREWAQAGQQQLPALRSPFVTSGSIANSLPPECAAHIQEEKATLEAGGYGKEAWLHHVFECELCCAPLLADTMEMHVEQVIVHPHLVVLFDFDMHTLKARYREQLDALMRDFDPAHDHILLIARASNIGSRGYNIALSGRRAGEVKDYFLDTFEADDSRVSYLFLGFDPPQLTPVLAERYGVTNDDLASVNVTVNLSGQAAINQSVVVVVYRGVGEVGEQSRTNTVRGRK